jgi:xanthine dehydrogenase molybdopterin-binding subunit B
MTTYLITPCYLGAISTTVTASTPDHAAREWARQSDRGHGVYWIANGHQVEIVVVDEATGERWRFRMRGEAELRYYAKEVGP